MDRFSLTILTGKPAIDWLNDPANEEAWTDLYRRCPWRFPTLAPAYYRTWLAHYGHEWEAVLVLASDPAGRLHGVFPLARSGDVVTGAGAHQAEYQGWLSTAGDAAPFARAALKLVSGTCPAHRIRLRYLAPAIPKHLIGALCRDDRVIASTHPRPLLALNAGALGKALRKKGTRSKINRLQRLGRLEFRRLTGIEEISQHLDEIIGLYDFRQGAANDCSPFLEDPHKKDFLLELAGTAAADELHISCLTLNGRIIGAHIGVISGDQAQLAILAYSPLYAAFSPGKLQIYYTARMLAEEGLAWFDLTPGGDPWKERFATDHDQVLSLEVHPSKWQAHRVRVKGRAEGIARGLLGSLGLSPARLRALLGGKRLPGTGPRVGVRKATPAPGAGAVLRWNGILPDGASGSAPVRRNALDDLIRYRGPDRQAFLRDAMRRLESGQTTYTMVLDERLVCWGWVSPEQGGSPGATLQGIHARAGHDDQLLPLVWRILRDLKDTGVDAVYLDAEPGQETSGWARGMGFGMAGATPSRPPSQTGET